eukprot:snap_masked-scaffold_10-processed-gene-12.31-mRNA-1 protein AED:1.00 eAED:1.00 QI:0/-1/0/0/-1/1/1/0/74
MSNGHEGDHNILSEATNKVTEELIPKERVRFFHTSNSQETIELLRQKKMNWRNASAKEKNRRTRKVATAVRRDR